MNGMESRYASLLEARKHAGEIIWYGFEPVTLKLAADTRYTPDFCVMLANGELEFRETKGRLEDDALAKIKVAARFFPARFYLIYAKPKSLGGGWDVREVPA